MDKKLKFALKQNFTAPLPQRKNDFINSISYPKTKFRQVLFSQIGFIRKWVWLTFFAIAGFGFAYTNYITIPESNVPVLSALLPLFSLCTTTEVYKSIAHNMAELELACKYNLSKITLMRLAILGTISFIMLTLYVILAGKNGFGAFRNLVYLGVPYLLSSYLSLIAISKFRNKQTIYVCTAISGGVSILTVVASDSYKFIYQPGFTILWVTAFIILAGLTGFSLLRFKNLQEELQWNLL